jgi:hypothetical protein
MAEKEKSKKRKRHPEAQNEPRKKAVPAASSPKAAFLSVKVKHIPPEESALGPIVGECNCGSHQTVNSKLTWGQPSRQAYLLPKTSPSHLTENL